MAKRKSESEKGKASLAERRAKLAEKNAANRAKRDAFFAKHPGLEETIESERKAIQKRKAERAADSEFLREHGYTREAFAALAARKQAKPQP